MKIKEMKADKSFLLIPVADGAGWFKLEGEAQYLGIYLDGVLQEEHEVVLSREPRCWSCLYLEAYQGKTIEVRLEGGDESLIDLLEQSDTLKDADTLYQEDTRPFVHFTPMHGFMNDPNGLYYHDGKYHYFAQLNPYGFGVANTHWLHAVSDDLMHWQELPYALRPDETGRMYSGGGIVDIENTSGLGKDGQPPIFLFYTAAGSKSRQSRGRYFETAIAVSFDGGVSFEKYAKNPVVPYITFMNRDPKVVWNAEEKMWIMFLFLDNDRYLLLYSDNLLEWEKGQTIKIDGSAECPDIFCLPLNGDENCQKWVLWGSTDNYIIGDFNGKMFIPETETIVGPSHQVVSAYSDSIRTSGAYAAQTFTGLPQGRVVQMSWVTTKMTRGPFSSCASIPNEIRLIETSKGYRLTVLPVQEVRKMAKKSFSFTNRGLEELERVPTEYFGEAMDISFRFSLLNDNLMAVSVRGILMVYNPKEHMLILPNGTFKLETEKENLELRVITDRCSVEIYADGGLFHTVLNTVLDPANVSVKPILLDPSVAVDFEIHQLSSIWDKKI